MGKTGRKKKSGKGQDADTTTLDNNNMKDMELPDDLWLQHIRLQ